MVKRQSPVRGGRPNRVRVQLSDEQLALLQARADAEGVTVSRYLVDTALSRHQVSNRVVVTELLGLRRQLSDRSEDMSKEMMVRLNAALDRYQP